MSDAPKNNKPKYRIGKKNYKQRKDWSLPVEKPASKK